MSEQVAFGLIVAGVVVAPAIAFALARRGTVSAAIAIGAGFAGFAPFVLARWRPDMVAAWISTDLALLYPAAGGIPAVALLVALAMRTTERNRRGVLVFAVIVAGYSTWEAAFLLRDPASFLGTRGPAGGKWQGDCFMQSTLWSCAPAASCSLLRTAGVEATEGEMCRLMRARERYGTSELAMWRGVSRKVEGTPHRAVLRSVDYDGLVAAHAPALVSIQFMAIIDHAITVVAADPEGVSVLDPARGAGRCSRAEFEKIWRGRAIFLERTPTP